jgi:8-hydroxy-5-deazaflavin:NADPH oxidoreductase
VIRRRTVLAGLGATVAASSLARAQAQGSVPAQRASERIAILGTGKLGQALARCWVRTGHPIVFGSRTPDDERVKKVAQDIAAGSGDARDVSATSAGPRSAAPAVSVTTPRGAIAQADIVLFALPWRAVKDLVPTLGDLNGKIIIDPMNAALTITDGYPAPPTELISLSEQLQALAPGAKVVKAFNTPTAANMLNPARAGGHVSIPLAGADVAAKSRVAALVSQIGLEPVDTGPLVAARYIEAMFLVSVGYVIYTKGKFFEFNLVPVKT